MSILAHLRENESNFFEKLLHPFTGLDHIAAMIMTATSIALLLVAFRGRDAATTEGTTTRVRTIGLMAVSAVLLVASITLVLAL